MKNTMISNQHQVILGMAASDVHAVANQLIAMSLRDRGYLVVNLGVCTPLEEFAAACDSLPQAEAVLIGSVNGHAYEDLVGLPALRRVGRIPCPVIVGGNLSVGSCKDEGVTDRLHHLGVDYVLESADQLPDLLDRLGSPAGEPYLEAR